MGKDYKYPALKEGECYLNSLQKDQINAVVGSFININVDIYYLYDKLVDRYNSDYAPLIGQPPIKISTPKLKT